MPGKRKRSRRNSTPPSPPPFIPPTPPSEDVEDDLTPPPSITTPAALQNIDILRQVLSFTDKKTLWSAFTVSTRWYDVTGPLLFQSVSLTCGESVLRLMIEHAPQKKTRRHTKKTFSSLDFLKHTVHVRVGFHLSKTNCSPGWITRLAAIFPNALWVEKLSMQYNSSCNIGCRCGIHNWEFVQTLNPRQIFLDSLRSYESFDIPSLCTTAWTTESTLSLNYDFTSRWSSYDYHPDSSQLRRFESVRILYTNYRRQDLRHIPAMSMKTFTLGDWDFERWERASDTPSMSKMSAEIIKLIKQSPEVKKWEFYMLGDSVPRESSYWPHNSGSQSVLKGEKDIEHLVLKEIPKEQNEIEVRFKTRHDFLTEADRYETSRDKLSSIYQDARTIKDHHASPGLYGTWKLATKVCDPAAFK